VLAVQWHPERSVGRDSGSLKLFQSYVAAAAGWAASHGANKRRNLLEL
jgi:gamma-glutamyl-gamma-aminobutyrate hydrolase PuuD